MGTLPEETTSVYVNLECHGASCFVSGHPVRSGRAGAAGPEGKATSKSEAKRFTETRPCLPGLAKWEGRQETRTRLWVWCSGPGLPASPHPSSTLCGWHFPQGIRQSAWSGRLLPERWKKKKKMSALRRPRAPGWNAEGLWAPGPAWPRPAEGLGGSGWSPGDLPLRWC